MRPAADVGASLAASRRRRGATGTPNRARWLLRSLAFVSMLMFPGRAGLAEQARGGSEPSADENAVQEPPIEITVKGRRPLRAPWSATDPTAATTEVRGEPLRKPGATSTDVLERVPGVQTTRSGAGSELATASLRGASASQTPVYVAGIRINDDVTGTADLATVPLFLLESVEVFRGSAPFRADRLGIGGAIFFEPRDPARDEAGGGAALGSYGHRSGWLFGSLRARAHGALFGFRAESADNDYPFENDRGTRFDPSDDFEDQRKNADHGTRELWAIGRHRLGESRVTSVLSAYEREQGAAGLLIIAADHARARTGRLLAGVSSSVPCPGAEDPEACRLELASSGLFARYALEDPENELATGTELTSTRGRRVAEEATLTGRISDSLRAALTARAAFETLGIDQSGTATLRARRLTSQAAAQAEWSPGILAFYALGSFERHDTAATASEASSSEPAGRVGARLRAIDGNAPSLELRVNVSRTQRPPTLGELFGVSALVRGNRELREERALGADAGLRSVFDQTGVPVQAFLDGFFFVRGVDELIAYRQSSLGVIRPFNVAEARILGAEAALGVVLFERVRLDGGLTAMESVDVSPGRTIANDVLPYRSRLVAFGRTELATEEPISWLERVAVGAELFHRSSRFADPAGLIVIPAHTTFDFDLTVATLERHLVFRFALDNAFDARAFDTVGLPLPGRSLFASAEASVW